MIQSVLALTMPFIFVIVITWLKMNEKYRRNKLQADLYAKAIENGQPVPANLFEETKKLKREQTPLNNGIILIAVGVGISLFFYLMGSSFASINPDASNSMISVASVGAIPFLIGIAFFIIHLIEKKKAINENAQ